MKYIFFFSVNFQKRNNFGVMFIKTASVKCKFNVTILIPNILDLTLRIFILKKRMWSNSKQNSEEMNSDKFMNRFEEKIAFRPQPFSRTDREWDCK